MLCLSIGCASAFGVSAAKKPTQSAAATKLLQLATRRFKQGMSAAEKNLVTTTCDGSEDDCTTFAGKDRVIRGELLAWLCTDSDASKYVTYHGISILGAEIAGQVNLEFAKVLFPLRILECVLREAFVLRKGDISSLDLAGSNAERGVDLTSAVIDGDLVCDGCQFVGTDEAFAIDANSVHVKGFVFLRKDSDSEHEFSAVGGVNFINAKIDKNLDCDGGYFFGNDETPALNAHGAQIDGSVLLGNGFSAKGEVRLVGAKINGNLNCHRGSFVNTGHGPSIDAAGARIAGSAWLTKGSERNARFTAEGGVDFTRATIDGNLDCTGSQFFSSGDAGALNANGLEVKGDVSFANDFIAWGGVSIRRASIRGDLNCIGGRFISDDKTAALNANGANIKGSAFLRKDRDAINGFRADGGVDFTHATIGGDLDCSGGEFLNTSPLPALDAPSTKIERNVYLRERMLAKGLVNFEYADIDGVFEWADVWSPEKATLDLQFAKVATLSNDEHFFSNYRDVSLDGFVFDRFGETATQTAKVQLAWLDRHLGNTFLAQPFEQLTAVLRKTGFQEEAVDIMIAKNERMGRQAIAKDRDSIHKSNNIWKKAAGFGKKLVDLSWYRFVGPFIGYWYRPWNALYASLLMIAIGAIFFKVGYYRQIIIPTSEDAYRSIGNKGRRWLKETYPKFSAVIYSLETFVPLVELALEKHWIPSANHGGTLRAGRFVLVRTGGLLRCYLWFHIIAGWVLTTLWVGGFTGLLKPAGGT
jgi:hypothetical protein